MHKLYNKYYHKWRNFDLLTAILGNSGFMVFFIFNEIMMTTHTKNRNIEMWPNAMDDPYNREKSTNVARMFVCVLSFFAIICLFQRHYYKCMWKKLYFVSDSYTRLYFRYSEVTSDEMDLYKPIHIELFNENLLFEVMILLANPIPYFDMYITHEAKDGVIVHYFLSEFMLSIMALRLFFIVRSYFNYSIYTDSYSKKLCQQYGFSANN